MSSTSDISNQTGGGSSTTRSVNTQKIAECSKCKAWINPVGQTVGGVYSCVHKFGPVGGLAPSPQPPPPSESLVLRPLRTDETMARDHTLEVLKHTKQHIARFTKDQSELRQNAKGCEADIKETVQSAIKKLKAREDKLIKEARVFYAEREKKLDDNIRKLIAHKKRCESTNESVTSTMMQKKMLVEEEETPVREANIKLMNDTIKDTPPVFEIPTDMIFANTFADDVERYIEKMGDNNVTDLEYPPLRQVENYPPPSPNAQLQVQAAQPPADVQAVGGPANAAPVDVNPPTFPQFTVNTDQTRISDDNKSILVTYKLKKMKDPNASEEDTKEADLVKENATIEIRCIDVASGQAMGKIHASVASKNERYRFFNIAKIAYESPLTKAPSLKLQCRLSYTRGSTLFFDTPNGDWIDAGTISSAASLVYIGSFRDKQVSVAMEAGAPITAQGLGGAITAKCGFQVPPNHLVHLDLKSASTQKIEKQNLTDADLGAINPRTHHIVCRVERVVSAAPPLQSAQSAVAVQPKLGSESKGGKVNVKVRMGQGSYKRLRPTDGGASLELFRQAIRSKFESSNPPIQVPPQFDVIVEGDPKKNTVDRVISSDADMIHVREKNAKAFVRPN